jgi:hypothetical protein
MNFDDLSLKRYLALADYMPEVAAFIDDYTDTGENE